MGERRSEEGREEGFAEKGVQRKTPMAKFGEVRQVNR